MSSLIAIFHVWDIEFVSINSRKLRAVSVTDGRRKPDNTAVRNPRGNSWPIHPDAAENRLEADYRQRNSVR
jgi:hypothetical protein